MRSNSYLFSVRRLIKIPGLSDAIDEITEALTVCVLSIIQVLSSRDKLMKPFLKPITQLVSENVSKASYLVMADQDQYLVWNDPNSSDPTHSMLSKDHFRHHTPQPF